MGREGWRKGARLKERGASRVYTGQVFRFHGIIKGSRATWNSISSAVVDDGTSWDVPRMCFFSSFLPFFLFSSREEVWRILSLIWDCREIVKKERFESIFLFFRLFLIELILKDFEDFQFLIPSLLNFLNERWRRIFRGILRSERWSSRMKFKMWKEKVKLDF